MPNETTLFGPTASVVEDAIANSDPFSGTSGFAGELDDGKLVRDVLGRFPLFTERDGSQWSFTPVDLTEPLSLPAGHVSTATGTERVWSIPTPEPTHDAVETLEDTVLAVVDAVPSDVAVAFSGGLDSALAATGAPDAPLYVVGFPGCHDIEVASKSAQTLSRDLTIVELDHDTVRNAIPVVARATGRTNAMDLAIALGLYFVGRAAAADGFDRLVVGQGADELFGGYAKVAAVDHRVDADTVRGATNEVIATLPGQLERDVLALRAAGVEPVAPFLHDTVVEPALSLPSKQLVAPDGTRKVALRRIAGGRLPASIVEKKKKAMQYGTYINRELDRLARQNGFKRRHDRHVDRYIESLLPEHQNDSAPNNP